MHRRPLIVRLANWIGDVVLSLPALDLLQAHGFDLHLYGKGWAPTLLSGYPWTVHKRSGSAPARLAELIALRRACQAADPGFSGRVNALTMPNSFSSALELKLAGCKVGGFARDGRGVLLTRRVAEPSGPHELEHFLALASALVEQPLALPESIQFRLRPQAHARAAELVHERRWLRGFVAVVPFAVGTLDKQNKRWPGFPALVERLVDEGLVVVICPGPGSEAQEARSLYPRAQIVEDLPLDVYAAVLQRSRLVIANDTGPGHLAAGVGAALLSVLGPTEIDRTRAWGPRVRLLLPIYL